jgi:AraC family transcriptional regulator
MENFRIYIRNMVCRRCIWTVEQELVKLKMKAIQVALGEVVLSKKPSRTQMAAFGKQLEPLGFELIEDSRKIIIEKMKTLLIQKIQEGQLEEHFSIRKYLTPYLPKDYSGAARLFSEVESITVEHYFILQKMEKVKEWLAYDELTLSEIAWKLGYSNLAHLSAQFKKITGLTSSHFKKLASKRRIALDKV